MTNHVISHENISFQKHLSVIKAQEAVSKQPTLKMLDPNVLPFYEAWKSQVTLPNFCITLKVIDQNGSIDPKFLESTIDARLTLDGSALANLKHIVNTELDATCITVSSNEDKEPELPSYYLDQEYVDLCNKYHIPYKAVYHSYSELDATEEEIADYADLLKTAKNLCIHWDTSTYDPEGLAQAIEEYHSSEEADHDYFASARSDRWAYYSNLGV
jgi:hypothetical protein